MTTSRNPRSRTASPAAPVGCSNLKLRQLTRCVTQHYDAEMAVAGLKTTQFSLLSHVLKMGPVRPVDLAQAMRLDASTLTRNLAPLIAAGWVVLGSGADARSRSVSITPAGRAKHAEARRRWRAAQDGLQNRLGIERVAALHELLDDCLVRLADSEPASGVDA